MYGKIFESIYDGTLRADWKALITFQQLIILADCDGVVDMTAHAIHGRTGIPLDIIEHGLKVLAEPDPHSRSPEQEGRRIVLLDGHRPWGWKLVNHSYYRDLISRADKREKDRIRIADKRKNTEKSGVSQDVAGCRVESQGVSDVAHASCKLQSTKLKEVPPGLDLAAWSRWENYRREIRKPIKTASREAAAKSLAKFCKDQMAVVEQSIANGWQGLFDLKDKKKPTHVSPALVPPPKPDTGPKLSPDQIQKNHQRLVETVRPMLSKGSVSR